MTTKKIIGFYSKKPILKKNRASYDCDKCGLYKSCNTPRMQPTGEGKLKCLIIAEAPGHQEDLEGTQLVGDSGQFLRNKLSKYGLDLDVDFRKTNSLICRPPRNKKPTVTQLKCCTTNWKKEIETFKPNFIWLMGSSAIQAMYSGRTKYMTIGSWRHLCVPDPITKAYVIPLFHPSYLLRNDRDKGLHATFERDLKFAISCFKKPPFKFTDYESKLECLIEYDAIIYFLQDIINRKLASTIDYETTALKPYGPGRVVVSIGVTTVERSVAFPFNHPDFWNDDPCRLKYDSIKKLMQQILWNPDIKKTVQNLSFEKLWSDDYILRDTEFRSNGWYWDTILGTHTLDNRTNFTQLEFQGLVNFGIEPYDHESNKYKDSEKGGLNRMDQMPITALLKYNAMDALVTDLLKNKQERLFKNDPRKKAFDFLMEGVQSLSFLQRIGIATDEVYLNEVYNDLVTKIGTIDKELLNSKEAEQFKKLTHKSLLIKKDLSSTDLKTLLFNVLNIKSDKLTDKGSLSTDEEVLINAKHPFTNKILKRRKLSKIVNTYLNQWIVESNDGVVRPFFNLSTTRTHRSSANSPNSQNIPTRDPETKQLIRRGIVPRPGRKLAEADFSGMEVSTGTCYHKDPSMITYLVDPKTDMHRDVTCDIWRIKPTEVTKDLRFYSKNCWTFAQFYGDYYGNCAKNLWLKARKLLTISGESVESHIKELGIKNYDQFEAHCEQVEYKFWNERFKAYSRWKDEIFESYLACGYVETFYGFRFIGPMNRKDVSNYPIQSSAFHILLECLNELIKRKLKYNWKTDFINEVHDSIWIDMVPQEEKMIIENIKEVCEDWILKRNKWIIVPMKIDIKIGEIGGSLDKL